MPKRKRLKLHQQKTDPSQHKYKVVTIAGNSKQSHVDGIGPEASFLFFWGLAIDKNDTIYVAEIYDQIRKIHRENGQYHVSTLEASKVNAKTTTRLNLDHQGNFLTRRDIPFKIYSIGSIVMRSDGVLFAADGASDAIIKVEKDGEVVVLDEKCEIEDTDGIRKPFRIPSAMVLDKDENLLIADGFGRIRKLDKDCKKVHTELGKVFSTRRKTLSKLNLFEFDCIIDMTFNNTKDRLYINERKHGIVVWHYDTEVISVVALGMEPQAWSFGQMAFDSQGNLIVGDYGKLCIRKIILATITWNEARVLWIGHKKNKPEDCPLARIPRDVIFEVIRWCLLD